MTAGQIVCIIVRLWNMATGHWFWETSGETFWLPCTSKCQNIQL